MGIKKEKIMEYQYNGTPATPQSYGKRMLHIWGPLLLKWGIALGVMMIAAGICSYIYMSNHMEATMKAMENQDEMMNLYMTISEELMKYQTLIEGIAALATIPIMLFFFHKDRVKEKLAGAIANKKAPLWKYSMVILISLAMCFGLNNLIVLANFSSMSGAYEETMKILYSPSLPVQLLCLGILIPICEELVFRGLMFKRLRGQTSFLQSAIYSSVVFGLLHMNMVQMLYGIFLGMMLAYLYEKFGSVKAPILAHIVMNIFSVLATNGKLFDWLTADIMRIGIATIICAAVASTMFVFIQRIEEQPDLHDVEGENVDISV